MDFAYFVSSQGPLAWKFFGNALASWIAFTVSASILYAALLWIRRGLGARVGVVAALTGEGVEHLIADLISKTHSLFLLATALYSACLFLYLPPRSLEDTQITF